MNKTAAIIVAAGSSIRMGGKNKLLLPLGGEPVITRTLRAFGQAGVDEIILVGPSALEDHIPPLAVPLRRVEGGADRSASVRAGLACVHDAEIVLVHDGARPLISQKVIADCIKSARELGSGVAAVKVKDTIKKAEGMLVSVTPPRDKLFAAQTPQAFRMDILKAAYASGLSATDDAALVEAAGFPVHLVLAEEKNMKITTPSDIPLAEAFLGLAPRIGHGMDVHRLVEGRKLILGGVEVPHTLGLLGHSDADVLTHALIDAVLGAAGLPDIGRQFPDSDPQYKGACSLDLLRRTAELIAPHVRIQYADTTLAAQKPKLAPYIAEMEKNLTEALGAPVHVKATTTEKLGYTGREEGILAHAVAIGFACAPAEEI